MYNPTLKGLRFENRTSAYSPLVTTIKPPQGDAYVILLEKVKPYQVALVKPVAYQWSYIVDFPFLMRNPCSSTTTSEEQCFLTPFFLLHQRLVQTFHIFWATEFCAGGHNSGCAGGDSESHSVMQRRALRQFEDNAG